MARSNAAAFRRRRRWTRSRDYGAKPKGVRGWAIAMVALPLAAFTAVFAWDGQPSWQAQSAVQVAGAGTEQEPATRFGRCGGMGRLGGNCVVDGDTFWYGGEKIRIADINTPEVSDPGCGREAELGAAATDRLQALLNQGAFTLEPIDRDRDKYGRLLRVATRDGESLGATLVDEGLAEEWQGFRRDWC